jgi:hypothetical protein
VKYEEVYLKDYRDLEVALPSLRQYFRFYNEDRIHEALAYRTPAVVYGAVGCGRRRKAHSTHDVYCPPRGAVQSTTTEVDSILNN